MHIWIWPNCYIGFIYRQRGFKEQLKTDYCKLAQIAKLPIFLTSKSVTTGPGFVSPSLASRINSGIQNHLCKPERDDSFSLFWNKESNVSVLGNISLRNKTKATWTIRLMPWSVLDTLWQLNKLCITKLGRHSCKLFHFLALFCPN